jgi:hypothetical protein
VGNAYTNVVPRKRGSDRLLRLVNMGLGTTHNDFTVTVSTAFAGPVSAVQLYAPERPPVPLETRSKGRFTEIRIPVLEQWGIVTLR